MLESQFYLRIILIVVFGILFIFSMLTKGKKNSAEDPSEKHTVLKIFSVILFVWALFSLIMGIIAIASIQFPMVMEEQPLGPNTLIRDSSARLIWGYPTHGQNLAFTYITGVFAPLAFAAYFAVFKKSSVKWWHKAIKVVGIILMWMFYISSTNLHYFDLSELFPTVAFLILAIIGLTYKGKVLTNTITIDEPNNSAETMNGDASHHVTSEGTTAESSQSSIETTDVEL